MATHGQLPKEQWLAEGEPNHDAMMVSLLFRYYLSVKKCDLRPTKIQQYLGMTCDSDMAMFRILQDNLDSLHQLFQVLLEAWRLSLLFNAL